MGKLTRLTILKLGGSLITYKDKPLTPNIQNIKSVARAIAKSGLPTREDKLFLVHGGGSFGHYYAKKYGLSVRPRVASAEGISNTTNAMLQLHSLTRKILTDCGVNCESVTTSEIMAYGRDRISSTGAERIQTCFDSRLVPISFGNVGLKSKGASIISGDRIAYAVAKRFNANTVVFAMDVDGIFRNPDLQGPVIKTLSVTDNVKTSRRNLDVTGGVLAKLKTGFELARLGTNVFYVNGSKPERIVKILRGVEKVRATKILGKRR